MCESFLLLKDLLIVLTAIQKRKENHFQRHVPILLLFTFACVCVWHLNGFVLSRLNKVSKGETLLSHQKHDVFRKAI